MNKRGQSIIEYALIAVLVILGIVFMGPYVLRSVNAHFKLWDEGVQDSFTENITQAPVNVIPNITTNCTCTDSDGGCGSATSPQCPANERIWNHNCIPVDSQCDGQPTFHCQPDDSCCTTYIPQGCGTVPCPADTGCSGAPTSPPAAANNCYYGQRISATQCSDLPIQCNTDPACDPKCQGILSPGAVFCATGTTSWKQANLLQTYGITYVQQYAANCNSNSTCQVYCAPPTLLNSTGTSCLVTYTVTACQDPKGCGPCWGYCPPWSGGNTSTLACAAPGTTITAISIKAVPSGQSTTSPIVIPPGPGEDGCQNPNNSGQDEGEPSDTCQVSFTY